MLIAILYIILAIVEAAKTNNAPIKKGIKVFLYSAFSSTLPIIYFNPITIITITDITDPIVLITVMVLFPIVFKLSICYLSPPFKSLTDIPKEIFNVIVNIITKNTIIFNIRYLFFIYSSH